MATKNSTAKNVKPPSPPAALVKKLIKNVVHEYRYVKTVYSLEKLDDFRFKNGCKFAYVKRCPRFKSTILHCTGRRMRAGMCPFSLMAQRTAKGANEFHVYAHSQHNHHVKSEVERASQRVPRYVLVPDADPPVNITTPDCRKWTFLETAKNANKMDKLRLKHHCQRLKENYRMSMKCNTRKCRFRLLALKTDRGRYHMYTSGLHTGICRFENDKNAERKDVTEELLEEMEEKDDLEKIAENEMNTDDETGEWPIEEIKRRLSEALREGNAGQVDKWMARTGQQRIGALLAGMDHVDMIKLLKIAEQESGEGCSKENISSSANWLVWLRETLQEVLLLLSLAQHSELINLQPVEREMMKEE